MRTAVNLIGAIIIVLVGSPASAANKPCLCGPENSQTFNSTPPLNGLCTSNETWYSFIGGGPWSWWCKATHGNSCNPVACIANYSPPPPLTLTLTVTPNNPLVSDVAPVGTAIATVMVKWSDNSPFAGTIRFAAPFFNDNGTFALSGNALVTATDISGFDGTIQKVTLQAHQ